MNPFLARHWAAAVVLVFACSSGLAAQAARYSVVPKASLAWWQMDPNFSHLWATTCPDDPSWQPGEGRSPGYYVDYYRRHPTKSSAQLDARIPLYPRERVRYVCRTAVLGQVDVADTTDWRVSGGSISVLPDSLVTGLDMRDTFARRKVFQTNQYPAVRFTIDSLTNRRQVGDTLNAVAVGTLELHGVRTPMSAPTQLWREGGGLRVKADLHFPAKDLTHVYEMSGEALGMGVTLGMWKEVHFGVDLLMTRINQPTGM